LKADHLKQRQESNFFQGRDKPTFSTVDFLWRFARFDPTGQSFPLIHGVPPFLFPAKPLAEPASAPQSGTTGGTNPPKRGTRTASLSPLNEEK
jgi:hypothetical protein